MSALLLLAVSCKKEKEQGKGFNAIAEAHQDGSKTHLNGKAVNWDNNDQVLVFNKNYPTGYVFTASLVDSENPKKTLLTNADAPEDFYVQSYQALYPKAKVTKDGGNFKMTLPATQNAVFSSGKFQPQFENGANPMGVCNATTEDLYFENICGILDLQLYSTIAHNVKNITLTNNGDGNLNGTAIVNLSSAHPTLGTLSGGTKTITLNCNGKALSTDANNPSHFFFVLPAGTLAQGFTVTVTKTNGDVWTKTAAAHAENEIERSTITVMPKMEVEEPVIVVPEGAIPGLFSVSPTKKVFFSQGYLYYNQSNSKWYFWDKQTDYDIKGYDPTGNKVSLFTWGYGTWSTDPFTNQCAAATASSSSFVDWGVNHIENGGAGNPWYTLSSEEWDYMLGARFGDYHPDGDGHYTHWYNNIYEEQIGTTCVHLRVNGVYGLLIYADDYTGTRYSVGANLSAIPEKCAFLACAGWREPNGAHDFRFLPGYWPNDGSEYTSVWAAGIDKWDSPNYNSTGLSIGTNVHNGSFNVCNLQNRTYGFPVRLVQTYVPSTK